MKRRQASRRWIRSLILLAATFVGCSPGDPPPGWNADTSPPALGAGGTAVLGEPAAAAANSLSGQVTYYSSAAPVSGVTLNLNGSTTNTSATTSAAGQYAFAGVASEAVQLIPAKSGETTGAISALDATYVLQWLVGLRSLTSDQRLACDVTGNGSLSAFDAALILQRAVGLLSGFPLATACGSDWLFVPNPLAVPNQQVLAPVVQSGTCQPGRIAYNPLAQNAAGQDFRALVIGDCTGNWVQPAPPTPTPTSTPAGTPTRTPTPAPAGPGPRVVIAALVPGNGCLACGLGNCLCGTTPTPTPALDGQGRRVFPWVDGVGFWLVVEAVAGDNDAAPGQSLPAPCSGGGRPALEIESNRPLGDGQPPLCPPPPTPPQVSGVPGFAVPDFGSSPSVLEALQAFGSRFTVELFPEDACTLDGDGNPNFLSAVPPTPVETTTRQYCYLVSPNLRFPAGDTLLTMRVADWAGVTGPTVQVVVRLPTATPTPPG